MRYKVILFFIIGLLNIQSFGQSLFFSKQDSLRGNTSGVRFSWDVKRYDLYVNPDFENKTITGVQKITFKCLRELPNAIQIDLQEPMVMDQVRMKNKILKFKREGNVYWVEIGKTKINKNHVLEISFHGKPKEAINPPWDGGWIWEKDSNGKPFVSVACQGLGASSWFPCKDSQSDEPDSGASLSIETPDTLSAIGNGRMTAQKRTPKTKTIITTWEVSNPINSYNIIPYIGDYVNFSDTFNGLNGILELNYFVLKGKEMKAKNHFSDVKKMLKAFEYWFGPYPFYQDGYKLVEAPHLGMEHQSAIAYGNKFKTGYLGTDLSGTGHGLGWDFIIVHESGHEWFGNNITSNDIADMWIHESFTNYSESLFIEYWYGKKAAGEYVAGLRKKISNDIPIIGPYGVNREGSGDMYNKGGNMIHTIRQIINNDSLFREILIGLNTHYKHKTVNTTDIENYMIRMAQKNLSPIFDQYLRNTQIPTLVCHSKSGNSFSYAWENCISGFEMPIKIIVNKTESIWLNASNKEHTFEYEKGEIESIEPDPGFYVQFRLIGS